MCIVRERIVAPEGKERADRKEEFAWCGITEAKKQEGSTVSKIAH